MADTPENTEPTQPHIKGTWKDPYSRDILLPPDLIEQLRAKIGQQSDADRKVAELKAQGYKSYNDAAAEIGISVTALYSRTEIIKPEEDYLSNGCKPEGKPGEKIIKGSMLRWKHPHNTKILFLHPDYVTGQANAEKRAAQLRQQGYKSYDEAADICGFSRATIAGRVQQIDSDINYLPDASIPKGAAEERILKGSEIRWANPYNFQNVLLHPEFIEAHAKIEKEEKSYRERGYVPLSEAASQIGIQVGALQARTYQLEPEGDYLVDGTKAAEQTENTIKGNVLCWRNPHTSKVVLLHPEYVRKQAEVEQEAKKLLSMGYQPVSQVASELDMDATVLQTRTRKAINPDEEYLANGNKPTGAEGEITLKGSQIRWISPLYKTYVLLHPEYIAKLKNSYDKETDLRTQGYKTAQEVTAEIGVEIPSSRTSKLKPKTTYYPDGQKAPENYTGATLTGAAIKWADPANPQKILLHPDFIKTHVEAENRLNELKRQGFKDISEAAAEIGIASSIVSDRVGRLAGDVLYGMDGLPPKGTPNEHTEKGAALKWTHPYNWHITLLHPEFIQAQKAVEDRFKTLKDTGYFPINEAAEYMGVEAGTLRARLQQIEPENDYLIDGAKPKGIPGEKIVKGNVIKWVHPYNPQTVLLNSEYIEVHADIAQQTITELKQKGYEPVAEAANKIGITAASLGRRASKIKPDDDYLPDGTKPIKGDQTPTVKGSVIRWVHPHNKNYTLLAPQYVQAQHAAEMKEKELLSKGYKTHNEAGAITGLDAKTTIEARARAISDDKDHSLKGTTPVEGEPTVKGRELAWRHPYGKNVLLHPQLIQGWVEAENTRKELLGKKWLSISGAAVALDANYMMVYKRAMKIQADKSYTSAGLSPQGSDAALKGSELVWKHPYSRDEEGVVLINPTLIDAWKKADVEQQQLRSKGYKTIAEGAEITGLDRSGVIEERARKIKSDQNYTMQGIKPTDNEPTVSGSELVWRHPYGVTAGGGVLLHPELVNNWQQGKGKVLKGASSEKIGAAPELPSDVIQALEKKEPGTTPEVGG